MAHFALLDRDNVVVSVVVIDNEDCKDEDGTESEVRGIEFCKSLWGEDGRYVQTSYNGSFRGKYAGIGDRYDERSDIFVPPRPFASWVLNELTAEWEAPVPMPIEGAWYWHEPSQNWKEDI